MAKGNVINIVRFLSARLKTSGLKVSKIILFGSHAANKSTMDSDIDLVIISEDFSNKNILERVQLLKDAEIAAIKKFMIPLDIVAMTPGEFKNQASPVANLARNGKVMHAV